MPPPKPNGRSTKKRCPLCYRLVADIEKHSELIHNSTNIIPVDIDPLSCQHCNKSLMNIYRKREHYLSCHMNPSRTKYSCSFCEAMFYQKYNLKLHVSRFHLTLRKKTSPTKERAAVNELITSFQTNKLDVTELFSIVASRSVISSSLGASQLTSTITLTEKGKTIAAQGLVEELLQKVAKNILHKRDMEAGSARRKTQKNTVYQISVESKQGLSYPITGSFQSDLDFHSVFERIERVAQSSKDLYFASDLTLTIFERDIPVIRGRSITIRNCGLDIDGFIKRKHNIIDPQPMLNTLRLEYKLATSCLPVAVALCIFKTVYRTTIVKNNKVPEKFLGLVRNLQALIEPETGTYIKHFHPIAELIYKRYGKQLIITIIDLEKITTNVIYKYHTDSAQLLPDLSSNKHRIYLLINNSHCYAVTNPKSFFAKKALCNKCGFLRKRSGTGVYYCLNKICYKRSKLHCQLCGSDTCKDSTVLDACMRFCQYCHFYATSRLCYDNHMNTDESGCRNELIRCLICYKSIEKENFNQTTHENTDCSLNKCRTCRQVYDIRYKNEHVCHIPRPPNLADPDRVLYADAETFTGANHRVYPNVICCIVTCKKCRSNDSRAPVPCCGERGLSFTGAECMQQFITEIILNVKYRNYLLVFHYGHNFDAILLLQALVQMRVSIRNLITRGLKVYNMVVGPNRCTVRDTFLMFPCSLEKFCSAMNVQTASKYFFPHLLNGPNALQLVKNKAPGKCYYIVPKHRAEEFNIFHRSIKNKKFDFRSKIVKYCLEDCRALWLSAERFRATIATQLSVPNIYASCISTASAAMLCFRRNFMIPRSIAIVSEHNPTNQNSAEAFLYITWLNKRFGFDFVHAGQLNGELRVNSQLVDGYSRSKRISYQHLGCEVHSHLSVHCAKRRSRSGRNVFDPSRTHYYVYENTLSRLRALQQGNHRVVARWSCEMNEKIKVDAEFRQFINDHKAVDWDMNLRSCLYGGRVECMSLHCELSAAQVQAGYRIRYLDFISMYPYLLNTVEFPTSRPKTLHRPTLAEVLSADGRQLLYRGVMSVKILPNQTDYHVGLLPVRMSIGSTAASSQSTSTSQDQPAAAVFYPLCAACARAGIHGCMQAVECNHNDQERALVGQWTTLEIQFCLDHGWRILECVQVVYFDVFRADIFKKYIGHFARQKILASPYPAHINTEQERQAYLDVFSEQLGLERPMRTAEWKQCPISRAIAKLFLNCLWGKMSQKRFGRTVISSDVNEIANLFEKHKDILKSANLLTESTMLIELDNELADQIPHPYNNLVIAAFCTAAGRLMILREAILPACRHVSASQEAGSPTALYCDTDSIIMLQPPGAPIIAMSRYPVLGCLLSEVEDELRNPIVEFISMGSKSLVESFIQQQAGTFEKQ